MKKTVLVLGAGASEPFGFPSSFELSRTILGMKITFPEDELWKTNDFSKTDIDEFRALFSHAGGSSIDEFLGHRQGYDKMIKIGRTAIADALLPHEITDSLFSLRPNPNRPTIDRTANWYEPLFHLIAQERAFEDLDLSWLSVVTFNYDRSFEQFMFVSIKSAHPGVKDVDVAKKIKKMKIIHVHGSLGQLPWQTSPKDTTFITYDAPRKRPDKAPRFPSELGLRAGKNIRIIYESQKVRREFVRAQKLLQDAARVLFLGFGFHPLNLERLAVQKLKPLTLSGTIYGITLDTWKRLDELDLFVNARVARSRPMARNFQKMKVNEFLHERVSFRD